MKKNRTKNINKGLSIKEIDNSRTGGKIALFGFSYQLLYSCFISLKFLNNDNSRLRLEGIEDVDLYKSELYEKENIYHIQLKCSNIKQSATFFNSILKNFLEVYLVDKHNKNRFFLLVYDVQMAKGYLANLIDNNLNEFSTDHWNDKIERIKKDNPHWDWNDFNLSHFFKQLQFENLAKKTIEDNIIRLLIDRFSIDTGNEDLYINSLFFNVFHKALGRSVFTHQELLNLIQDVNENISKGYQNPTYQWVDRISFENKYFENDDDEYFEGKKATPSDIVRGLPVNRTSLEKSVIESIRTNKITVLKSSSGQGKTTLAWQAAYKLRNEYTTYKLNWCKDSKELNNIVEYFNSRLKVGEKILLILDNLDEELKEWNKLSQKIYEKIVLNFTILITTREEDWYSFSSDQSNLSKLNIIDLFLDTAQAENIYLKLKNENRIHESIQDWQTPWEKVQTKKLLLEYVYLLTHGEMLETRISHQLKSISKEKNSTIKLELLRQIGLADILGIRLPGDKLLEQFDKANGNCVDLNSILQSIEKEYFIKITNTINYVEGLHPVRSKHIIDFLHEYHSISKTLEKLTTIVDEFYVGKLYSQLPFYIDTNNTDFYRNIANDNKDRSYNFLFNSLKGIFYGSIKTYYLKNIDIFNDAYIHGGLQLFSNEINPWNSKEYGVEVKTIEDLYKISPTDNIKYLLELSYEIPKFDIQSSTFYIYTSLLYLNIKDQDIKLDLSGFASLVSWFLRVDKCFHLKSSLEIDLIWNNREIWDFDELALIIYEYSQSSPNKYLIFYKKRRSEILSYLKTKTNSLKIHEKDNRIYISYILLPNDIQKANSESVRRINNVCRFIPIFDTYCADAIQPQLEIFNGILRHDDSHKEMPKENVTIAFNVDLNRLWNNSISSHYEFDSVYEWQRYWINLRRNIVMFVKMNIVALETKMKKQRLSDSSLLKLTEAVNNISSSLRCVKLFPYENRPFEPPSKVHIYTGKFNGGYFSSIRNYLGQFANIFENRPENRLSNLAMINLKESIQSLTDMQLCFRSVCKHSIEYFDVTDLENEEKLWLDRLLNVNDFFLNYDYTEIFTRHEVSKWKRKITYSFHNKVNELITKINNNCDFTFVTGDKVLSEGILTTLPLAVINVVPTDEEVFLLLLESLLPLSEIDISYILIIFIDEQFKALPSGIRINVDFLKELKNCIENNIEFDSKTVCIPLPCELNDDHLHCFQKPIEILHKNNNESIDIVNLFVLLWEYSYLKNNFNPSCYEETAYLKKTLKIKSAKIDLEIDLIENKKPHSWIDELIFLKNEILNDKFVFDNDQLNNCISKYVTYFVKRTVS